ncbi:MAG: hypothetical protein FJ315_01320 [SAR202 cluster bacterium]|nr:hypothetical protein [SAR202 cluster bacterium]
MLPDDNPQQQDQGDQASDDLGLSGISLPSNLRTGSGIVRSVARLRLLMAAVERRYVESQRRVMVLRQQLRRVPTRAVNGHLALDAYLAVMAETRSRLQRAEQELEDLEVLKRRVSKDLSALELMGKIQHTQQELAELREQARWDGRDEVKQEVKRLERLAGDYVAQAAKSITTGEELPPSLDPPTAP